MTTPASCADSRAKNRPARTVLAATMVGFALAGTLTGCGASAEAAAEASATATAETTATAAPSVTSAATQPATGTKASPAASAAPSKAADAAPAQAAPALKRFTFPDGHVSFSYPADWTVATAAGAKLPGSTADSRIASVRDAGGNVLATIRSGAYEGDASGPVASRLVIDQAEVNLPDQKRTAVFAFHADTLPDGRTWYRMGVDSGPLGAADKATGAGSVFLPNGILSAQAVFDENAPFVSLAAAKAWYAGKQGQQLRALFLSMSYA